ncbi:acetyl-coenzyme a transporter [Cyclospora cayetanensis]|uniref:Acetyl-coenzyme a transporter n=1 Tax=Cyclospora cayetanensis TaxID=88456 RepID=A0A1D3D2G1_9EIME|nr:acetyl-coenzyme a transporter [Cyclospora cayetanensis]
MHFFADDVLAQAGGDTGGDEESRCEEEGSCEPKGALESYRLLWKLLFLSPVRQLMLVILTARVGFAAVDAATQLKIIERGVSKEQLAFFAPLLMPFGIVCPFLVSLR